MSSCGEEERGEMCGWFEETEDLSRPTSHLSETIQKGHTLKHNSKTLLGSPSSGNKGASSETQQAVKTCDIKIICSLPLHTHLCHAFQAEARWEGQEGQAPFSALPAAYAVETNAVVTGTRGVERRGSLIASVFCVRIQQCHPREGVGRGGGCSSTTQSHIQHLLHLHFRESGLYWINLHMTQHFITSNSNVKQLSQQRGYKLEGWKE